MGGSVGVWLTKRWGKIQTPKSKHPQKLQTSRSKIQRNSKLQSQIRFRGAGAGEPGNRSEGVKKCMNARPHPGPLPPSPPRSPRGEGGPFAAFGIILQL